MHGGGECVCEREETGWGYGMLVTSVYRLSGSERCAAVVCVSADSTRGTVCYRRAELCTIQHRHIVHWDICDLDVLWNLTAPLSSHLPSLSFSFSHTCMYAFVIVIVAVLQSHIFFKRTAVVSSFFLYLYIPPIPFSVASFAFVVHFHFQHSPAFPACLPLPVTFLRFYPSVLLTSLSSMSKQDSQLYSP